MLAAARGVLHVHQRTMNNFKSQVSAITRKIFLSWANAVRASKAEDIRQKLLVERKEALALKRFNNVWRFRTHRTVISWQSFVKMVRFERKAILQIVNAMLPWRRGFAPPFHAQHGLPQVLESLDVFGMFPGSSRFDVMKSHVRDFHDFSWPFVTSKCPCPGGEGIAPPFHPQDGMPLVFLVLDHLRA